MVLNYLLLFVTSVYAQNLVSKSFDIRTETTRPRFTTLYKDHDGLIWTGTDHGLFTFDGINFSKISGSDSIKAGSVTTIYSTSDSTKWIGYDNGNIAKVNGRSFQIYSPQEGLPKASISAIIEDTNGILYIATKGEGVYFIDHKKLNNIDHEDGLSDNYCYAMQLLPDGRIVVGTDEGLNFIKLDKEKKIITKFGFSDGLPDDIVRTITLSSNNSLILGLQDKGICKFDYLRNKILSYPLELSKGQVDHVVELKNEIWIEFEETGIKKLNHYGKVEVIHLDNDNIEKASGLISDNENNIWISKSIHLIRTSGDKIKLNYKINNQKYDSIHCIISDHLGGLWFSPDKDLVHLFKDQNQNWISQTFEIQKGDKKADIVTLYEDEYHFLWIGTLGEGIYRLNPITGKTRSFFQKQNLEESSILSITGEGNKIWVGGFNGVSIYEVKENGEKDNAEIIKSQYLEKLSHDYVYTIFIDSKKRIWFGTDENGAYYLENGNLVNIPLNQKSVHTFTEDTDGKIWFSIQDGGLAYYKNSQIKYFSTKDGLSDPSTSSLLRMKNGKIIIVHANGFDILDPHSLIIVYHSTEENLGDINPDLNSITESKDSIIWIGTEKGIIQYSAIFDLNINHPQLSIQNISVNQKDETISKRVFSYDENNIRFDVAGLWYSDPLRVNYRYILEGYTTVWESTKDHILSFSKLPPGKYLLKIKSSLNNNFTNTQEISYSFKISPPIWQTWVFRIGFAILIFLIIIFIVRRREKNLIRLNLLQKEKVEFQFETLKNQVNPHFLFNSFNTLTNIIETDPNLAVEYVEKLSEFFRSIVNYRDKNLITIGEELSLLENYIFIQKKRYGNNLEININVTLEIQTNYYIPPLTLQLLAENAIKHNAISKESTLLIMVNNIHNNKLLIENNINKKLTKETGSGMGLQNIIGRFKLLTDEKVIIQESIDKFQVYIPLLKSNK